MNELKRQAENVRDEPASIAPLDAQLTELIEFVWACEVCGSARRAHRCRDSVREQLVLEMKAITGRWLMATE